MRADRSLSPAAWAAAAPVLCAVHCLLAPLLVSLAPSLSLGGAAERALLAGAAAVAAGALWSELRAHRRRGVLAPVLAGFALWAASLAGVLSPLREELTTVLGSLTVAAGMIWSARLRHRAHCAGCGCPASGG